MAEMMMTKGMTATFMGPEVKTGSVTVAAMNDKRMLTLSDDFTVPDAPAPHWQVVDSMGNTYLLRRLVTAGDVYNKSVAVPAYVKDVAKVQIYCAFAEVLLGEAVLAR